MKNILLVILIGISASSFGQDCAKFKDGKFKLVDIEFGDYIIERKGSKQVEYGGTDKLRLEFKVKWVDDCTYTLKIKKVLDNPKNLTVPKGIVITVHIIETTDNYYIQRTSTSQSKDVLENKMILIDENAFEK